MLQLFYNHQPPIFHGNNVALMTGSEDAQFGRLAACFGSA
jgi:spore maturation protein SpmB